MSALGLALGGGEDGSAALPAADELSGAPERSSVRRDRDAEKKAFREGDGGARGTATHCTPHHSILCQIIRRA